MVPYDSRTTASRVCFAHPFRLGRDPRELPPGSYAIHTVEDVYQGAVEPFYVARSIDLVVETAGGSSARIVLPADLREARQRDAARSVQLAGANADGEVPAASACVGR